MYKNETEQERWMQTAVQFWEGEWSREGVITQRRVGTCRGQRSPQCCSWLFPGWDLQPWVTCPAETKGGRLRGQGCVEDTYLLSDISHNCVHWSAASSWNHCCDRLQSPKAFEGVCYLEDFCLAGVGVCMLFPGLLGVMLVLPLGPDLTGTSLELGSTLTAFPRHIWKHKQWSYSYIILALLKKELRLDLNNFSNFCVFQMAGQTKQIIKECPLGKV